jgi:hypothetical protein
VRPGRGRREHGVGLVWLQLWSPSGARSRTSRSAGWSAGRAVDGGGHVRLFLCAEGWVTGFRRRRWWCGASRRRGFGGHRGHRGTGAATGHRAASSRSACARGG